MSDNGTVDDSPRRWPRAILGVHTAANRSALRQHQQDSQLSAQQYAQRVRRQQLFEMSQSRTHTRPSTFGASHVQRRNATSEESMPHSFRITPYGLVTSETALNTASVEPPLMEKGRTGKPQPITTLVSALPKTAYCEQNEAKDTERTLAYIKVQRRLLGWLSRHPADSLTASEARKWTKAIEPKPRVPSARDALRLCYYMRSQTFDTYAKIRDGYINLYIANQNFNDRKHDFLYWKQSYKTNYLEDTVPSHTPILEPDGAPTSEMSYDEFMAMARGASTLGRDPGLWNIPELPRPERETPTFGAHIAQKSGVAPTAGDVDGEALTQLRNSAEADLNRLLMEEDPDSAAIQAALAQIEEIDEQLQ